MINGSLNGLTEKSQNGIKETKMKRSILIVEEMLADMKEAEKEYHQSDAFYTRVAAKISVLEEAINRIKNEITIYEGEIKKDPYGSRDNYFCIDGEIVENLFNKYKEGKKIRVIIEESEGD